MFRSPDSNEQKKPQARADEASLNYDSCENNNIYASVSAASETTSRAFAESAMIAREIREGVLSAFVASTSKITGQIEFKALLRIDGLVSGRVTSAEGTLVVASAGRVHANVAVAVARIRGTVTGDLTCSERIDLGPTAKVTGNIHAPTVVIEPGAVLDGTCRMTTPAADAQIASEPIAQETFAAPEVAVVQSAITPLEATAQKDPVAAKAQKIGRKGNVLGAKPRRTRTKVATKKTATAKHANDERAAAAVAG
jgi:cytoskeletal protein CcmA (bactofilin family)